MSRPLRIEYAGAVYHVSAGGNERKPVFRDDHDRGRFLDILHQVNRRYHWICHGYCLMSNHYHLLIETPEGNLALGMRQLNGVYTQFFNKYHERTGHLFQGRYKAVLIQKDTHLLEVCRYTVLNPVRARICRTPEGYRWSSYVATAGKAEPHACLTTKWVLEQFGRKKSIAQKDYRKFISEGIGRPSAWSDVRDQVLWGEDDFVQKLREHLRKRKNVSEFPRSQRYAHRPPLKALFGREPDWGRTKRRKSILRAIEHYGYRQAEIADHLGLHYSTISRIAKGER